MSSAGPAARTRRAQSAPFVTSAWMKLPWISFATRSPLFASMSFTTTRQPSSAKRRAMPAPNPEPAPVMMASLFVSRIALSYALKAMP
jgi:hypothetical protein